MRFFTFAMAAIVALQLNSHAFADEISPQAVKHEARETLAKDMANMVLSVLKNKRQSVNDRQSALQQGFTNVMDIKWIAQFVLGAAWKNASEEQKERYTELYERYLTGVYVSTYAENSDRQITDIKVLGIHDADNEDNFTARTHILMSDFDSIKVDYLVSARGEDEYKIIDIAIEGVSLLATHRAEFSKLAASSGVDGVIRKLERLLNPEKPGLLLSMK